MIKRYFHLYTLITVLTFLLFLGSYELGGIINNQSTLKNAIVLTVTAQEKRVIPSVNILKTNQTSPAKKALAAITESNALEEIKNVYLTFDDGPTKYTEEILDTLLENQAKATFFPLKNNIDRYPQIVKRIVREGNAIGCHGVTHDVTQFYATPNTTLNEILSCNQSLSDVTGNTSKLIRVPFGSYPYMKESHRELINNAGFIMWDWNIDSEDWTLTSDDQVKNSVETQLAQLAKKNITPVILFHDKKVTSEALELIIKLLDDQDYTFSTITEDLTPLQFRPAD